MFGSVFGWDHRFESRHTTPFNTLQMVQSLLRLQRTVFQRVDPVQLDSFNAQPIFNRSPYTFSKLFAEPTLLCARSQVRRDGGCRIRQRDPWLQFEPSTFQLDWDGSICGILADHLKFIQDLVDRLEGRGCR